MKTTQTILRSRIQF
uniref:Uncharacterized protein n=1 Tax=Rhizophora mucronata TaxID=61149 RepID=A0A2P2QTB3_RHIMU